MPICGWKSAWCVQFTETEWEYPTNFDISRDFMQLKPYTNYMYVDSYSEKSFQTKSFLTKSMSATWFDTKRPTKSFFNENYHLTFRHPFFCLLEIYCRAYSLYFTIISFKLYSMWPGKFDWDLKSTFRINDSIFLC